MKKFFFPFAKKYSYLSNHAWHRLAIVGYWVIIIISLGGIYFSLLIPQRNGLDNCQVTWLGLNPGIMPQQLDAQCNSFNPSPGLDFFVAIIGTVIISYIVQLLYYKVLLYIAFGNRKSSGIS